MNNPDTVYKICQVLPHEVVGEVFAYWLFLTIHRIAAYALLLGAGFVWYALFTTHSALESQIALSYLAIYGLLLIIYVMAYFYSPRVIHDLELCERLLEGDFYYIEA